MKTTVLIDMGEYCKVESIQCDSVEKLKEEVLKRIDDKVIEVSIRVSNYSEERVKVNYLYKWDILSELVEDIVPALKRATMEILKTKDIYAVDLAKILMEDAARYNNAYPCRRETFGDETFSTAFKKLGNRNAINNSDR